MAEELAGPGFYSYNLQTETPIMIDDMIYSLEPRDLPLFAGIGADGLPVLTREPCSNTVFYWLEEEAPLPRGTVNEALDDSETGVTMATGDAVKFAVGDHIRIDDEFMKVTALDTTTEELTVVRGALGSTPAAHDNGSDVIGVGTALPEGDIGSANYQGRDKYSNYTQIWTGKVTVSRTEQGIRKYGVPNELARQMLKRVQHFMLGAEQAAVYGLKYEDSSTRVRSTGGLWGWITTNVNSTDAWMDVQGIETQQQAVYDLGGMFTHIMAKPGAYGALNNIEGNERIQTVTIDDPRRGRVRASQVMTEFGPVNLVRNRWLRSTDAIGFIPGQFTFKQFQPLITQPLAKTDDTDSWMIVMEGGFQCKGQSHMAKWSALDPSAAVPEGSGV